MPRRLNRLNRQVCTVAFDHTFDAIYEIKVPFDFCYSNTRIVGSCNGLLCLSGYGPDSDTVIYLWNPSIRKYKKLPDRGVPHSQTFGFAYHSENNDYKVVRISRTGLTVDDIEVYTLSLDSWRRINGISLRSDVFLNNFNGGLPIPLVGGALHWLGEILGKEKRWRRKRIIISFDVNSETFREIAVPDGSMDTSPSQPCVALFKGKLAAIAIGSDGKRGKQYSIWVMKEYGVVESWHKLFVVPFQCPSHYVAITEYGSLLIRYPIEKHSSKEEDEYKSVIVDATTLHERDTNIQDLDSYAATFMESLALLDGSNVVSYSGKIVDVE